MTQTSSGHVFMSYSRRDNDVMWRITRFLRDQGIKVWVDNEKLVPGTPIWEEEIEKAIKGTSAIVVVLSPDAKNSEWVRREIALADQYRKRIFPMLVRGDEDSSITLRLVTRQFIDIRENENAGLSSLSTSILFYFEELENQQRVEREEAEKLARAEAERRAAEREAEQLRVEREAAEKATLVAVEKAAHEQAERESAEKAAREAAEIAAQEKTEKEAAKREIARLIAEKEAADKLAKEKLKNILSNYWLRLVASAVIAGAAIFWFTFYAPVSINNSLAVITSTNANKVSQITRRNNSWLRQINTVKFSHDGKILFTVDESFNSNKTRIKFWEMSNLTLIHTIDALSGGFAVGPDWIIGDINPFIKIWRISDGSLVREIEPNYPGGCNFPSSIDVSLDGNIIASDGEYPTSGSPENICFWQSSDGVAIRLFNAKEADINGLAFSPNGTILASASSDVRLWNVSDGTLIRTLEADNTRDFSSLAFSPDGETLAAGTSPREMTIRLWNVSNGTLIRKIEAYSNEFGYASCLVFSPDGTILASGGSEDGTIKLWNVSDGSLLRTLEGHNSAVNSLAFSPDGTLLASGSDDGTVRLWGIKP